MLMLKAEQVQYCRVHRQEKGRVETVPGIAYENKLFVKSKSFAKDQKEKAIQRCRDDFAKQNGRILFLVVEEETGFTLWYEDGQVQLAEKPNLTDARSGINLDLLVANMRNVGGIEIKNRRYNLKIYSRCFVGSEAVSWLTDNLGISKQEAIALGQKLIDKKWIHHVTDDHQFKDEALFYRFYWDEK